ncbi:MAG: methyltransferase domain-containing protein [Candidatus Aminicenantes bacterium]|nr:methyltransferase domain-containing protein [Candidatus Aminicenantes bacterium]
MKGVLDYTYARQREKKSGIRYRLIRRTHEILQAIAKYRPDPKSVLDLGTAEGRMLSAVKCKYPAAFCVGIEYSLDLLQMGASLHPNLKFIRADAQRLQFLKHGSFDVAIAAAIIEHLHEPRTMIRESYRLLKPGGIMIITTPHPFWERIANGLGMIKGEHQFTMGLRSIQGLCQGECFAILEKKGFMISPIGFPGEVKIERVLQGIDLDKNLPNQLVVARKPI